MSPQLRRLAGKYLWWQAPGGAHTDARLIAQVMELGTHDDAETLRQELGDEMLRQVLKDAQPGWFSGKSWHYWHYALNAAAFGRVPDLPSRRYG